MRIVAIVPVYNTLRSIPAVLRELCAAGLPVILVDDGSTDGTHDWAIGWKDEASDRWVIRFDKNRGKGAALVEGFALAVSLGFDCAMTVDGDGQHGIADVLRIRDAVKPGSLLIGARNEYTPGYPSKSLFGRSLWALGVRALTGLGVSDPVCGLRAYPLVAGSTIRCVGGRYAWEAEYLIRSAWSGVPIDELPIETIYHPIEIRVSHFALRDWAESIANFVWLAPRRVLDLRPSRVCGPLLHRRDRSWRWMLFAELFVGGTVGVLAPLWISIVILAFVALRLHASPIVCIAAIFGGWLLETSLERALESSALAMSISLATIPLAAAATMRAARRLCSS